MKASEIQRVYTELTSIRAKRLPIKMSFVISRNLKKMEDVVQDIETKRSELIKQYGEKDASGDLIIEEDDRIKLTDTAAFIRDFSEILEADVTITLDKISLEDVEKCDQDGYDSLTVEEVGALSCMLNDGDTQS